jgi:uncharacterized integral membrane protein
VNQTPGSAPTESDETSGSGSAVGRVLGLLARHPAGVVRVVAFSLLAIIILQNVESTSIDVLFWSVPALPKLVLIFVSMFVGAAAWELTRRWMRR